MNITASEINTAPRSGIPPADRRRLRESLRRNRQRHGIDPRSGERLPRDPGPSHISTLVAFVLRRLGVSQ